MLVISQNIPEQRRDMGKESIKGLLHDVSYQPK